jgi:predicted CopG family antitoxin
MRVSTSLDADNSIASHGQFVQISCMASTTTTISLKEEAYRLLKELRQPGETFSDVIIANIRPPARTGREMLERLEELKRPLIDRELMGKVRASRGRSSHTRARHVR